MTADLVVWLRQQLDTDERNALLAQAEIEAAGKTWQGFADDIWKRATVDADGIADHVEANDPARVLRQVQAHRAILAEYERRVEAMRLYPNQGNANAMAALHDAVHALVSIYSDREGYRQEWSG